MTLEKEYFIHLLSSFVNGTVPEPEAVDLKKVLEFARVHNVQGIIAQQIKLLPSEYQLTDELESVLPQYIGRTVQKSAIKENALKAVDAFLCEKNIDHLYVKGAVVKKYYPVPELRTSGDIDIIVRSNAFESIVDIFKDSEFFVKSVITDTLTVNYSGTDFEIHKYADVNSEYFDDIFSLCSNNGCSYYLDEYNHLAYIICHLCKHLSYRGAGIRMLLDIDLMIRGISNFNPDNLLSICKKAGILHSTEAIIRLCNIWFNTPCIANADISGIMPAFESVMLDGGVFGYEMNAIPVSNLGKNKLGILFRLAFPPKDLLKKAYPYYDKNRLLLPIARLNRLYDAFTKKRRAVLNTVRQLNNGTDSMQIQRELIDELGIY